MWFTSVDVMPAVNFHYHLDASEPPETMARNVLPDEPCLTQRLQARLLMTLQRRFIGTPLRRLEDPDLVRGDACFLGDVKVADALTVRFVRCPHGHARVRRLSLATVRQMPGVVAAFGPHELEVLAKPVQPMNLDPGVEERTPCPLADEARFAGEAVAAIVADDPYRAEDAVYEAEAQIEYDELGVILNPAEAMGAAAPRIHGDVPSNVAGRLSFSMGDVGAAFAHADVTIVEHFESPQVASAIYGNVCRCTGYQNIVDAILRAGESMADAGRSQ